MPPEQVIGSSIKTRYEMRDGEPVLLRLPQLNFNNDRADKPVAINQHQLRARGVETRRTAFIHLNMRLFMANDALMRLHE